MLSAFASELFLKCLIGIETGKNPPGGHHLDALFDQLSLSTRRRITVFWDWYAIGMKPTWDQMDAIEGKTTPRALISALKLGSGGFERMRYYYEKDDENWEFFISGLPNMLQLMALELRPEWGGFPPGWRSPDDFSKPPPPRSVPPLRMTRT